MRTPFASLGERRSSIENPSVPIANALLTEWDRLTTAGVALSPEMAARVPDVFACIQVLAQDIGRCPLKLRKVNDDGSHEDVTDHPLSEVLSDLTNPETTAYQFREELTRSVLTYKKAYGEIIRNQRGEITAVWPLDARYMQTDRDSLNRKRWTYRPPNSPVQVWMFHPSTPPIFEWSHTSPIEHCRDLIGMAYALDQFGAKFFANGSRPSGTLEVPMGVPMDDEKRKDMRQAFQGMHGGSENAGKVAVLYNGVKFNPITIANDEAQYNETRKFIRTLIAGVFRMPPHKIGDLERATFSNIEQQSIDYVTGTLDPFLVSLEQVIRRDWLTTRQYPGYLALFDRQALIKADIQSLVNALAVGRQNGWWNANDIRQKLGENPIDGDAGTQYLVNGNMTPAADAADATDTTDTTVPDPPATDNTGDAA